MKRGPQQGEAKRKVHVALRAALLAVPVLLLLGQFSYVGHLSWNQYRARQCRSSHGYWRDQPAECLPPHDHCDHAGEIVAVGHSYYDGCNWCTCTPYFLRCTSKFCIR